jgi:hypothetical protein
MTTNAAGTVRPDCRYRRPFTASEPLDRRRRAARNRQADLVCADWLEAGLMSRRSARGYARELTDAGRATQHKR